MDFWGIFIDLWGHFSGGSKRAFVGLHNPLCMQCATNAGKSSISKHAVHENTGKHSISHHRVTKTLGIVAIVNAKSTINTV